AEDLGHRNAHDRQPRGGLDDPSVRIIAMIEFTLKQSTPAPIEKVFDSLTNHRGIADYVSMARRSTLDREGVPAPNGVGAVRRIEAIGPAIVEEIIEYVRPTR